MQQKVVNPAKVSGSVTFVAEITGTGMIFSRIEYSFHSFRIEIESTGKSIQLTGSFDQFDSDWLARETVRLIANAAFDRLSFTEGIVIQQAYAAAENFNYLDPIAGLHINSGEVAKGVETIEVTKKIDVSRIKTLLEAAESPCEHHYALLRDAIQSRSPVEEFMHLYTILLTLYDDEQVDVDAFIVSEQPSVARSPQPPTSRRPRLGRMETVYTRLRNELAHRRVGVDMNATKAAATSHVADLRTLVKRAIVLNP